MAMAPVSQEEFDLSWLFPPGFVAPDHTMLPETDGKFVQNFQEHPQSMLLTDVIRPLLDERHPDGEYVIGQDSGIYWSMERALSEQPLRGAVAPDWYYVPNRPPLLKGQVRRSYVMWYEIIAPLIIVEFVSGDGREERDRTPGAGKFWVYEQALRPAYYAIYEVNPGRVEVYRHVAGVFEPAPVDDHGNYPIAPLNVALGIWRGSYQHCDLPWLRWYSLDGNLLPTSDERAEAAAAQAEAAATRAEAEAARAEAEAARAERLAAKLRALGIDPEAE